MSKSVTIIDYGMGNIGSICNIIKKAGGSYNVSNEPSFIKESKKIILPGVGAFDNGISNLRDLNLIDAIKTSVASGDTYLLGICLGMQMLLENSEEGNLNGIGLIEGSVIKFRPTEKSEKVPHMGWNSIKIKDDNILFNKNDLNRYYFVHSYYAKCKNEKNVLAKSSYILEFDAAIYSKNIIGVQFHPEKSHKYGLELIKKFIAL